MATHEHEGQTYYLGVDRLKERAQETSAMIDNLTQEEEAIAQRLLHIRETKVFLNRERLRLWDMVREIEINHVETHE